MANIKDIIDGIKERIKVALPDHADLEFETNIDKNRYGQLEKGFAVRPLGLDQLSGPQGTIGRLNINQRFEVILTDRFTGGLGNDDEVITKTISLQEDAIDVFVEIAPNKISVGGVRIIEGLSMEDPEYDEGSKQIVVAITFNVQYSRTLKSEEA